MKYNLTDTAIRNAKPQPNGNPKKYTDGGGLYLLVNARGKYWRYKYRMNGKEKTLAIGIYQDSRNTPCFSYGDISVLAFSFW